MMTLIDINGDFAAQVLGAHALVLFHGPHDAHVYYIESYHVARFVATVKTQWELNELLALVNTPVPQSKSEWN